MNELDRRLIELNEALLALSSMNKPIDPSLLKNAQRALSGAIPSIDTGSGNDTVVINEEKCECPPGPPGPKRR